MSIPTSCVTSSSTTTRISTSSSASRGAAPSSLGSSTSTSTSTSTSLPSIGAASQGATIAQAQPTQAIYQDLWSFNFASEKFIQHKLRLVKVDGNPYIAFSKYYFNSSAQSFQPTKKQYFIPEHRWGELQRGLIALYNYIGHHRARAAAAAARPPGVEITEIVEDEPITSANRFTVDARENGEGVGRSAETSNNTNSSSNSSCAPTTSSSGGATAEPAKPSLKRGRGRPPKVSSTPVIKKCCNHSSLTGSGSAQMDEEAEVAAAVAAIVADEASNEAESEEKFDAGTGRE